MDVGIVVCISNVITGLAFGHRIIMKWSEDYALYVVYDVHMYS